MRKIFLILILIVLSVAIGLSWEQSKGENEFFAKNRKSVLLRFAVVADSHNENDLLEKALSQAKGSGVNFVIGLGEWSDLGTPEELTSAKGVFDRSGLTYYAMSGDRDLWDSRNRGEEATTNYHRVFGDATQTFSEKGIQFVLLDNSDIYKGISDEGWFLLKSWKTDENKLNFLFSYKTPFHPQSAHIMGEDDEEVAKEAEQYINYIEKRNIDGFFSGDLHFFAQFRSPKNNVKITTVGAVNSARNFQGPRFAIVTVFDDYTWEVEDVEIR